MTRPSEPPNPPMGEPHERPSQARILRELGEELRAESIPALDWGRVERGLFNRLDAETFDGHRSGSQQAPRAAVRKRATSSAVGRTVASSSVASSSASSTSAPSTSAPRRWQLARWHVAIAASVVLFITFGTLWRMDGTAPHAAVGHDAAGTGRAVGENGRSLERARSGDLTRLRAGDVVEATDGSVAYEAPGVVRWTLAAGGRLSVTQAVDASSHVLALERGSIRAEVTPAASRMQRLASDVVERLVIEVDGTRVAVRGTVFTVTRTTAGMVVNVERGTVAVGQIGPSGLTEGRLLVAPARRSFGLDGSSARTASAMGANQTLLAPSFEEGSLFLQEGAEPVELQDDGRIGGATRAAPRAAGAHDPRSAAAEPSAGSGAPVGDEPRTLTAASIRSGLSQCFDRTYRASSSKVGFSVSSTFHVTIDDRGAVTAARFVPPVRAELARCAGAVIAGKFASGPAQVAVPLQYDVGGRPQP